MMKFRTLIDTVILVAVSALILFANLGTARLWDRDEPRNAGCAAEMLARGDWVVPMFNDELRHQKPVLLYWLMMTSYSVFGVTEFAARFSSAVLALATVMLTYGIGRRLFGPRVGLLAGLVLVTSLMFVVAGRAATPDSVLIFCSTLALWIYVRGTFAAPGGETSHSQDATSGDGDSAILAPRLRVAGRWFPNHAWCIAMYGVMGLGVLAKGLAGCVLPTAIIGMFLLIQRAPADGTAHPERTFFAEAIARIWRVVNPWHFLKTCWAMRPVTAVGMILLIAAPWYVLVGLRTEGDFLREFLIGEHFGRATEAMENHGGGLWYYPLAILLGFFPWSIFAVPVWLQVDRELARREQQAPALVFLACWVLVQVGIFSVARTKLPSYVTPCYPGLALLTAFFLQRLVDGRQQIADFWMRGSYASQLLAGLAMLAGFGFLAHQLLPGEYRLLIVAAVPVVGGLLGIYLLIRKNYAACVWGSVAGGVLFVLLFFGLGTVWVSGHRHSQQMLVELGQQDAGTPLATYRCLESSWIYYARRPVVELLPLDQDRELHVAERERFWHDQPDLPLQQFLEQNDRGLVLTRSSHLAELRSRLPSDYAILRRERFFLNPDDLVLLGPSSEDARGASESVVGIREAETGAGQRVAGNAEPPNSEEFVQKR